MARYVDTKQGKYDVSDMEMLYNEHIARLGYQNRGEVATLYKEQRDRLSTALKEDVAPVIHAHWTRKRTLSHDGELYCSNCGWTPEVLGCTTLGDLQLADVYYCPHCCAKMDEEVGKCQKSN